MHKSKILLLSLILFSLSACFLPRNNSYFSKIQIVNKSGDSISEIKVMGFWNQWYITDKEWIENSYSDLMPGEESMPQDILTLAAHSDLLQSHKAQIPLLKIEYKKKGHILGKILVDNQDWMYIEDIKDEKTILKSEAFYTIVITDDGCIILDSNGKNLTNGSS